MLEVIAPYFICLLVLAVIYVALFLQRNTKSKYKFFLGFIISANALYLILCIITEILDTLRALPVLNYILNLVLFFSVDFLVVAFTLYIHYLINPEDNKRVKWIFRVPLFSSIGRIITIIVLASTNTLFKIENGIYTALSLVDIPYYFSGIIMLELIGIIIYFRKKLPLKYFIVIMIYQILPLFPIIVELFTEYYFLSGLAITISVLLIFVLLQDSTFEESKIKQEILESVMKEDQLTELPNRRAYYEFIESIKSDDTVGIVFCDLNGLKYINDHFGHTAGDERIRKFSIILTQVFSKECSFRISGDEFVVAVKNISLGEFKRKVNSLIVLIDRNGSIAAYGDTFGKGTVIDKLISEAEQLMYKCKENQGLSRDSILEKTGK